MAIASAAPAQGALPTRPLGTTGMDITSVGLGAWAIGGTEWGTQDEKSSLASIHRALERGINWIDTAPIYGLGRSEELLRRALKDIPSARRPYVFTKCGLLWNARRPIAPPRRAGSPESVRRELEQSLRRLGVGHIDLYQMHRPAEDVPLEEYWHTLLELKREGKVRAVGLSNHSLEQIERAERLGHVDSLQPPFSAIRREAAAQIAWCQARRVGVIAYSPMQAGLLTGAFTMQRARSLPEDDWRARDEQFTGDALARNLRLAEALRPVAERHGATAASVAVAWVLAWPGVTGAIVGARNPAQVDEWVGAATLELNGSDLEEIATAIARTGAGSGPALPR